MSGDGRGGTAGAPRPGPGTRDGGESRLAKLRIMAKEVTIACRPGEEDALKQAAAYIDHAMRELRSRNSTSSIEKIAIVTAINTADALLKERAAADALDASRSVEGAVPADALERVAGMNARIDALLDGHGLGGAPEPLPRTVRDTARDASSDRAASVAPHAVHVQVDGTGAAGGDRGHGAGRAEDDGSVDD